MLRVKRISGLIKASKPVIEKRCVHLDLKGAPPSCRRLVRLLEIFAAMRYNAVLVEWEDTFPWTVDKRFRSETAYSAATVNKFVKTAKRLGLELIPLVQCLGHMETPLRLPEYAPMREVAHDESMINPLAPGARRLVELMVDDVLKLMPDVSHFHLGGDEATTFGTHPDTKKYIARHGKGALYLHHVEPLLDKLNRRGIRPLLWHDMMCDWKPSALRRLARKADLVVWGYSGAPDTTTGHHKKENIERFVRFGIPLWGAAAYKGADGSGADLPNIARREENALEWVKVSRRYGFKGLIATAWSRYSTNWFQNEPIDGALDSALNVGVIFHDGRPLAGGIKECRAALNQIGEGLRFRRVFDALGKLSLTRGSTWTQIRIERQLLATVTTDKRRLPCYGLEQGLMRLRNALQRAEEACDDLRKALKGLMEDIWVERYIAERLQPLRDEFLDLNKKNENIKL